MGDAGVVPGLSWQEISFVEICSAMDAAVCKELLLLDWEWQDSDHHQCSDETWDQGAGLMVVIFFIFGLQKYSDHHRV